MYLFVPYLYKYGKERSENYMLHFRKMFTLPSIEKHPSHITKIMYCNVLNSLTENQIQRAHQHSNNRKKDLNAGVHSLISDAC